jgi:hypothetical protein
MLKKLLDKTHKNEYNTSMKMINSRINQFEADHPFWRIELKRWWRKWDFLILFFGSMTCFALLASLDEILKDIGLA